MWAYIADCWVCRQDVGSVPCSSVGPAPHATIPVVDQVPEGFTSLPSAPQDHSDAQRLPRSEAVEKTSVPPERSPAGSVPSSQDYNGHIPDGLGGGGVHQGCPVWVIWSEKHINVKGCHVLVRMDNITVVSYLNRQGGLGSRPLFRLARSVLLWALTKFLLISAVHILGHLNSGADLLLRLEDGEWRRHHQVVNLIRQKFG